MNDAYSLPILAGAGFLPALGIRHTYARYSSFKPLKPQRLR
jgi:hypothetical protein